MKKGFLVILLFAAFWACRGPEGLQTNNLAYLYNPQELALKPHFRFEHLSDTLTRVHYRIDNQDLLYRKNESLDNYQAAFAIRYWVLGKLESSQILDSNGVLVKDEMKKLAPKTLEGYFDINTPITERSAEDEGKYTLYLRFEDRSRDAQVAQFLKINKSSFNSRDHFLLTDSSGTAIFKPHLPVGVPFKIRHKTLNPKYLFVSLYQRDFPLALPPYSSRKSGAFELAPDTTFRWPADSLLALPEAGFYHFRLDTNQWQGFTLYSFSQNFPMVGNHQEMAEPLRYLTTQKEYSQLQEARKNPQALKKFIEEFWVLKAGSSERAKNLIAGYYGRVEEANRLFSSFHEGWKTDRGIIYIIYGPPTKVYQSSVGEAWVYGNENSALSYYFNFIQIENPFTANDFELERSSQYRFGWGQAIEAWRRGHQYNSKDIRQEQDNYDQLQYRGRTPMWY